MTDIGTFISANHPCRIQSATRGQNWRDLTFLLIVCVACFSGWLMMEMVR